MSEAAIEYDEGQEEVEAQPEAQEVEQEAPETPEELAKPEELPPVTFDERQQEFINNNIVAKKVAAQKAAEREAEELRQRLAQYEQQREDGEPVIPPVPEYDFDDVSYQKKLAERDEAIQKHAEWKLRQQQNQAWEQHQAQEREREQFEQLKTRLETYSGRADAMGISEGDLMMAGNAVHQIGIDPMVQDLIVDDENGPAITMYLAKNVQELAAINQLSPMRAAIHIATEIVPKVKRSQKRNNPPPPPEVPEGKGAPEQRRGPEGAKYR